MWYWWSDLAEFVFDCIIGTADIAVSRAEALRQERRAKGVCQHCGYDLRGTPYRCPECGTRAELRANPEMVEEIRGRAEAKRRLRSMQKARGPLLIQGDEEKR